MPTKTKPAAKPKAAAPKKPAAKKPKAPTLTRADARQKAVDAVQASLDHDGENIGEAAILELRNEFEKVQHHLVWRELFARARYSPEPK